MHSIKKNDMGLFREIMNKYFMEENIANFLTGRDYHSLLQQFKNELAYYLVKEYLFLIFDYHRDNIFEIFISEYGFEPDNYLLSEHLRYDYFINIIEILQKYMYIGQYFELIAHSFNHMCQKGSLEIIKKYDKIGFDIKQLVLYDKCNHLLCLMMAILNKDPAILKYLLDNDVDFHAYEKNLLSWCILYKALPQLKILIEYGADLKNFLNEQPNELSISEKGIINLLMEYGIDTILIYQLMTRAIY